LPLYSSAMRCPLDAFSISRLPVKTNYPFRMGNLSPYLDGKIYQWRSSEPASEWNTRKRAKECDCYSEVCKKNIGREREIPVLWSLVFCWIRTWRERERDREWGFKRRSGEVFFFLERERSREERWQRLCTRHGWHTLPCSLFSRYVLPSLFYCESHSSLFLILFIFFLHLRSVMDIVF
jgi:hypothetical protein